MKEIKVIETPEALNTIKSLKRVAAYARVSTKQELQASSLNMQIKHYVKEIIFNPDYIFSGIYADHGKSGTSMKNRDGFQDLMKKIRAGYIDLVLVKSLSRFARNTLEALKIIQETRKLGVEFYFEKENISSLDTTIDMILTMMAGMAEAESLSISENITWGFRKRAEKGQVPLRKLIGYDITKDRKYKINPNEAKVIKELFQMKLKGAKGREMIDYLNSNQITSTVGNSFTDSNQVINILKNESYIGKMVYGKKYTKVVNNQKVIVENDGIKPMYIITNHHEPIVDIDTFNQVQELFTSKQDGKPKTPNKHSEYTRFIYSMYHDAFLFKKTNSNRNPGNEMYENDKARKADFPRVYGKNVLSVLERAINALGRNFANIEGKLNKHVEDITNKQEMDQKMNEASRIIDSYKEEYYALLKRGNKDSADASLLSELEDMIIKFTLEYVELEDEAIQYIDVFKSAYKLKKTITSQSYPIQDLTSDIVKSIFSYLIVIDKENYAVVINLQNRELTPEELKKAATTKPLLQSKCKSKTDSNLLLNWQIVIL
ncbi:MAG: recombinase family protein [Candidatus Izemoplasmatales bacterium]|jgi:DNA invertase Pin-like site-specific DNA recombinase